MGAPRWTSRPARRRRGVETAGTDPIFHPRDAIQVNVTEGAVTISAETREEKHAGEEPTFLLRERSLGKFTRSVSLPQAVDEKTAEAKFADGVLQLALKKKQSSASKRLTIH